MRRYGQLADLRFSTPPLAEVYRVASNANMPIWCSVSAQTFADARLCLQAFCSRAFGMSSACARAGSAAARTCESGMTAVEYAVLAGFIIVVCAAAIAAFEAPAGSALANTGDSVGTYADP